MQAIAAAFANFCSIIRKLRGPDGCAWDKEQTVFSLRSNLIEEAYETIGAIEAENDDNLREELGDLYLLVTLLARIKAEEGAFVR